VVKRSNILRVLSATAVGCLFVSCASLPLLTPNPPGSEQKEPARTAGAAKATAKITEKPAEKPSHSKSGTPNAASGQQKNTESNNEVDFALALSDGNQTGDTARTIRPAEGEPEKKASAAQAAAPESTAVSLPVRGRMIRVALHQNTAKVALYSMDTMEVRAGLTGKSVARFRGAVTVSAEGKGVVSFEALNEAAREVALPCTLVARDESNLFNLGQESYRGSVIISGADKFTIVNYLDVEDYLRGVIPLEMGTQGKAAAEALKAQAIAARTYAYGRIAMHSAEPFDVVSTVADQMYGGADKETDEADFAVRSTRDRVIVWHGALTDVYYHSTCGGMTADIAEIWGREPCEYLTTVSDTGPDGRAWCSASKYFTWEESWTAEKLSVMLRSTVKQALPGQHFTGTVQGIDIKSRFGCGRVKACVVEGSVGMVACGGDKVRFVIRRKSASGQILRSANFTVEKNGPAEFSVKGRGYGHGVGLCQMGAIGRAQAGQKAEEILKAYFKNTEVRKVAVAGEGKF
jgi:stage II sporulation protein D